jgi:hypothetical protein
MASIDRTPCPECHLVEKLYIDIQLVAKPIGEFSLAGAQMKFSGKTCPVLKCRNCEFELVGEFDGETHATFSRREEVRSDN